MPVPLLELNNLCAAAEAKEILHGVDLTLTHGEVHALMGPNGSGKSTLANVLMGHPGYAVRGSIRFRGEDITALSPEKRARKGLFLSFQHPSEVPGVRVDHFLFSAKKAITGNARLSVQEFRRELDAAMQELGIGEDVLERGLNEGFSGGEKKRSEMLAMRVLKPKLAVLDETDSGLDIDAMKRIAESIARAHAEGMGVLLITHYRRILDYVKPDAVSVLVQGRIVDSGGAGLAEKLEKHGYAPYLREQLA